jgi:muramoyltetrapeptide carboxypeptidase
MITGISYLKAGDLIRIVAPAKAIDGELIDAAVQWLQENGFVIKVGTHAKGRHHYFAGTDEERMKDMQEALDDEHCKAIWCARGGYGSMRILDRLNWASFLREPKWLIGFSDITVFHHRIQKFDLPSIHATMPLNLGENSMEAKESLLNALHGKSNTYEWQGSEGDKHGCASGELIGGNLSIVYSMLGTSDRLDFQGKLLFIEDLSEQLYALDRMWHALEMHGALDAIAGLVVGGMTGMKDTDPATGFSVEQLILDKFRYRKIPVCFHFPAGHIDDNRALIFGKQATLDVQENFVRFSQ